MLEYWNLVDKEEVESDYMKLLTSALEILEKVPCDKKEQAKYSKKNDC